MLALLYDTHLGRDRQSRTADGSGQLALAPPLLLAILR